MTLIGIVLVVLVLLIAAGIFFGFNQARSSSIAVSVSTHIALLNSKP